MSSVKEALKFQTYCTKKDYHFLLKKCEELLQCFSHSFIKVLVYLVMKTKTTWQPCFEELGPGIYISFPDKEIPTKKGSALQEMNLLILSFKKWPN